MTEGEVDLIRTKLFQQKILSPLSPHKA